MKSLLVTLFLVTGPHSLETGDARTVIAKSQGYFAQAEIDLKITRIVKMRDRYGTLETIDESRRKFDLYRSFVRRIRGNRTSRVHVLLPPMREPGGIRYVGGFGETGCARYGISASNGQSFNADSLPRLNHSAVAVTHEIAHTAGAKHVDNVPNIMHPAALQFADDPELGWASSTVYRMKRCVR